MQGWRHWVGNDRDVCTIRAVAVKKVLLVVLVQYRGCPPGGGYVGSIAGDGGGVDAGQNLTLLIQPSSVA